MKDRPIIFSGPMVRALLEDRKTQTRRILKPQPPKIDDVRALSGSGYSWLAPTHMIPYWRVAGPVWAVRQLMGQDPRIFVRYAPGDLLWVRENVACGACAPSKPSQWAPSFWRREQGSPANPAGLWYQADGLCPERTTTERGKWVPSIYMPRWASRLTLRVKSVKLERLQEISEEDAWAEGVCTFAESQDKTTWGAVDGEARRVITRLTYGSAVKAFSAVWMSVNGEKSWDANPWVVALTFEVIRANIDQVAREARAA